MIYTMPDPLLARLAKGCIAHRQVAAGLKKKVGVGLGGWVVGWGCVCGMGWG